MQNGFCKETAVSKEIDEIMRTRITELFGITYPIIQGGLAYLAYAELAAAVSNSGGLGQITAMTLENPEQLQNEIRRTRELTDRPFGVNFAISRYRKADAWKEFLEVAIEEEVTAISVTGGNPAPLLERLQGETIRTLVLIADVKQAQKAEALGAAAVMAVGHEGGGHLGRFDTGTMVLTPRVAESVSIPVLASGGIGTGRGLLAAMALGAEGVEMGTRFIATKECVHASDVYKQAILNGDETGTMIIKQTLGNPARTLITEHALQIVLREREGAGFDELKDMVSGDANLRYLRDSDGDHGFAYAGQAIGLVRSIPSVQELFDEMMAEIAEERKRLASIFDCDEGRT